MKKIIQPYINNIEKQQNANKNVEEIKLIDLSKAGFKAPSGQVEIWLKY